MLSRPLVGDLGVCLKQERGNAEGALVRPFPRPTTETEGLAAKLMSFPVWLLLIAAFVVVAWNVQGSSRVCRNACEARGGVDHNYIPAQSGRRTTMPRPEECRCAFDDGGEIAWRAIQP